MNAKVKKAVNELGKGQMKKQKMKLISLLLAKAAHLECNRHKEK